MSIRRQDLPVIFEALEELFGANDIANTTALPTIGNQYRVEDIRGFKSTNPVTGQAVPLYYVVVYQALSAGVLPASPYVVVTIQMDNQGHFNNVSGFSPNCSTTASAGTTTLTLAVAAMQTAITANAAILSEVAAGTTPDGLD